MLKILKKSFYSFHSKFELIQSLSILILNKTNKDMNKKVKKVFITSVHNGRNTVWYDTMERMVDGIFGYTLECGNSWNSRIPRYPKTLESLIKALNNSAYECRQYDDYYTEASQEEMQKFFEANAEAIESGRGEINSLTIWK